MAARVGRIGSTAGCHCSIIERVTGFSIGLVMGSHFLLRHLLVAYLSYDPLRAHRGLVGLSAPDPASRISSHFPRPVQRRADSISLAFWFCGSFRRAAQLAPARVGSIHGHRTSMERSRLLTSNPSEVYSTSPVGRSLRDKFSDTHDARCARAHIPSSDDARNLLL